MRIQPAIANILYIPAGFELCLIRSGRASSPALQMMTHQKLPLILWPTHN
jgi:hypothetical protein